MITLNPTLRKIQRIAEIEFADIVDMTFEINCNLRIVLQDKSFIDVGVSQKLKGKFSFHWECKTGLYRYDNFPDRNWKHVTTFPFHFHNGSQDQVEATPFSFDVLAGFREFMEFVRRQYGV